MARYLLIESRDPFESNDVTYYYDLAADLAQHGNEVTLFLVQNGVLPARPSVHSGLLARVMQSGAEILADDFSLRERAIPEDTLVPGVKASPLDVVVDQLADGCKALWH
ncbi:MAG: sulfur reduction protein DsrE [Alphaproteobacteria bacterium]